MDNSPPIYVDFNNADAEGYVRLNCSGTLRDLERFGIALADGIAVIVHDGEIQADGIVRSAGSEGVWRLEVDWKGILEKHGKLAK
jgi:hypothetical protein